MKKEAVVLTLLMLISISSLTPFLSVSGQLGVNIYLVTPTGGVAGQLVNLQGTIDTTNGTYEVYMGNKLVATSLSEGFYVNANFSVPEVSAAVYTITLRDVTKKVNATEDFNVEIGYSIAAIVPPPPAQLQEGSEIILNVTLTGGKSVTNYYANVTVALPAPLSTEYSRLVTLSTASQTGTASLTIPFPSSEFQPLGSFTNLTGLYSVYFNKTALLASSQFFIGFTDASLYHRGEKVTIRAIGYGANQATEIKITNQETGTDFYTSSVSASSDGIVNAIWTVPNDALIGFYEVNISPQGNAKPIADSQNFTVPGYPVKIRTLNLAGAIVPDILVEAVDQATAKAYSATSEDNGIATLNLEKGIAVLTVYWNEVEVGGASLTVTEESAHDVICSLINLKIVVKDGSGFLVPFVSLNITYSYTTTKDGSSKTENVLGQTDISGTFILNSVLPGIDYKIIASLYRVVFNSGNSTYTDIPAVPTHEIVVLLPNRSLSMRILDYNLQGLPNARLALSEQTSGIFYANSTDLYGTASIEVGFGKYDLRIYKNDILLNATIIEVFNDTQSEIRCVLYNLEVSVLVVDYFGQPIPNVTVDFRGPDQVMRSNKTLSDGTTTFSNVIGGNVWLVAHPNGIEDYYEAVTLYVDSPTAVEIGFGKYVLLGSTLVEASLLLVLGIVLSIGVVLAILEFFRRRKANVSANSAKTVQPAN